MSSPGLLKSSELTTVQGSMQLSTKTARAWKRLQAAAKSKLKRNIAIAGPAGAYRSAAVQNAMHQAGGPSGTRAQRIRWGLNPASSVSIAAHPGGSHEKGTRVDIVGTPIDAAFLKLAKQYGFTREFGAADPNHFEHDGKTATAPTIAAVKPAPKKITYTVRSGDTLSGIAAKYSNTAAHKADLDVDDLLRLNPQIHDADKISVGDKIRVA